MMPIHDNLEFSVYRTASKIGTHRETSSKAVKSLTVFQNILKQFYNFRDRVEPFKFPKLQYNCNKSELSKIDVLEIYSLSD